MVEARTEYTKKLIKKYAWFNIYKNPGQIMIYCLLEIFILALSGILIYVASLTKGAGNNAAAIIPAVVLPLVIPVIIFLIPVFSARMNKNITGAVNEYKFSEEFAQFRLTMRENFGQAKVKYDFFENVYETKEMFYFYTSEKQVFILRKADITEGSVSDLRQLLKKNLREEQYISRGV